MSEGGSHVHGPHDHVFEHAAHDAGRDRFTGTIAVTRAIVATVGALFSYMATSRDEQSDAQMHLNRRWAQATTALQVSIALAAMALLTRRKWLELGMFGVSGIGLALGGLVVAHI